MNAKFYILLIVLALVFWILSLIQGIDFYALNYNEPIFLALNPLFWVSLLFIALLLIAAIMKERLDVLCIVVFLIIVIVGGIPYLIGLGRSHDSYQQLGFAMYIVDNGQKMNSLNFISGWPGFHILVASWILITGVEPTLLIKLFPFLNYAMFSFGLFLFIRTLFHDSRKALLAVLFTLLASNVFFFDFQMNWFTFCLISIFILTLISSDLKKNILAPIIFFTMTISHSINPVVSLFVVFTMSFFNLNLRKNRPIIYLCAVLYLVWTLYSGNYLITAIVNAFSKTNLSQSVGVLQGTTQYVLLPQNIPQLFNRIILAALLVTLLMTLLRKNLRKIYAPVSIPVILIISLSFLFPIVTSGFTSLAFKILPVAYMSGLPLVYLVLHDKLLNSAKSKRYLCRLNNRNTRKMILSICLVGLLFGFTFSAYEKEKFYAVTATNLDSAIFVSNSFHNGSIRVLWSGALLELYYVLYPNMTRIQPISSLELQSGLRADIAVVNNGWFDPAVASEHDITSDDFRVLNNVTRDFTLIYSDGGYSDIYAPAGTP